VNDPAAARSPRLAMRYSIESGATMRGGIFSSRSCMSPMRSVVIGCVRRYDGGAALLLLVHRDWRVHPLEEVRPAARVVAALSRA